MNTRAYIYEGLDFSKDEFSPRRNNRQRQVARDMIRRLGKYHAEAKSVRRERVLLSQMGEHQLVDIGLSPYDVQRGINR